MGSLPVTYARFLCGVSRDNLSPQQRARCCGLVLAMDLFVSYNRRDAAAASEIKRMLQIRGLQVFLDTECLHEGLPWPEALECAMLSSTAVAVIIGRGPLGEWQKREMYLALDLSVTARRRGGELPVIPVLLEGAEPTTTFLFQNTWVAFGERIDPSGIDRLVFAIRPSGGSFRQSATVCPYRALEAFREEHHAFYFGREAFVSAVFERVQQRNLVAVVGPSGSGKSSVVQAGLLPRIRRERNPAWEVVLFSPGADPYYRIADAMQFLMPDDIAPEAVGNLARKLESHESALGTEIAKALGRSNGSGRMLLIIDQFEEMFTQTAPAKAELFLATIIAAIGSAPVTVLLTLNAEFYSTAIKANRALADILPSGQINLGSLKESELREVIVEPARVVGCRFESDELVARMISEVRDEPGKLPLLEFALSEIWLRREGTTLTHSGYQQIGGVSGSIGKRAERVFAGLPPDDQDAVHPLFGRLVHVSNEEQGTDSRRRCERSHLAAPKVVDHCWRVAQIFAEPRNRLIVTSAGPSSGEEVVEVAHEALLRGAWPRLMEWIDLDREFLSWRQDLEVLTNTWAKSGTVLPPGMLAEAESWLKRRPNDINAHERLFIEASRKRRRRSRYAIVALLGVALAAIAIGGAFSTRFWKSKPSKQNLLFRSLGFTVPEIAAHYDFPILDGRGQTIVFIVETPGGYTDTDIDRYFQELGLPKPGITTVSVLGAENTPGTNTTGDLLVTSDIEVAGAVAPKALIKLYFVPAQNYLAAVELAVRSEANCVLVLSLPFAESETAWDEKALQQMNGMLQSAAARGITVITDTGNDGATNGVLDGQAHVGFPASSPWVLAVGGTSLTASGEYVGSEEVVWNDGGGQGATGGGVSSVFPMPDWQSVVKIPRRKDGGFGRGVPDVAANADPETGYLIYFDEHRDRLGGTELTAALWAGLIALIDQGVGHSVGYINPVLYTRIGPSGAFRSVTKGDNNIEQVKGCTAGSGWNACSGWGTPNGEMLLKAFKEARSGS